MFAPCDAVSSRKGGKEKESRTEGENPNSNFDKGAMTNSLRKGKKRRSRTDPKLWRRKKKRKICKANHLSPETLTENQKRKAKRGDHLVPYRPLGRGGGKKEEERDGGGGAGGVCGG